MYRILFICAGNSGRSQMAAAFALKLAAEDAELIAACDNIEAIHPVAVEAIDELNLNLPPFIEHTLSEVKTQLFDVVVTIGKRSLEHCPTFLGSPARIHWSLFDPARVAGDDPAEIRALFIEIRDEIRLRVTGLFEYGFLQSILQIRQKLGSLLECLADGVMAHDVHRRVYYFNRAAQRITGYSAAEVIGRDCHDIFPDLFCGGECSFCDGKLSKTTHLHYPRAFINKKHERRDLDMSLVALETPNEGVIGTLVNFRDISEIFRMQRTLERTRGFQGIVGHHPTMLSVFESIRELADVKVPILIVGESGTGKELVATALHNISKRSAGPFVPVNCGALPEGILESELFGHVRGAFTGAIHDRKGRFELAEGGTIFLDEIGEVSPALQVKLLRVLQDMTFMPVGGEKSVHVSVRVICATNRDLKSLTQRGAFRDDLYYRLAVVPIQLPPLREKCSDIPLLIEHLLEKFSGQTEWVVERIAPEAMELLMRYPWPGNVRELANAVQFGMIKCHGQSIEVKHLPQEIISHEQSLPASHVGRPAKLDKENVVKILRQTGGNKAKAARLLGISRMTLYRYILDSNVSHNALM